MFYLNDMAVLREGMEKIGLRYFSNTDLLAKRCINCILLCKECLQIDVITRVGHVLSEIITYFQILHYLSKENISED